MKWAHRTFAITSTGNRRTVLRRAGKAAQIAELVEVHDGPDSTHRVNSLVLTPLLPAEWRFAAYRSFLPDELSQHVKKWRTHIAEVRDGGHQTHHDAWYAYSMSRRLAEQWAALRQRPKDAGGRTNAWAVRPALIDVRRRILARTEPAVSPPPFWGRTFEVQRFDATPFVELAREWNRRVPANQRVFVTSPPSPEEFLDDPAPDETLQWMDETTAEGYGLLLDW